jgi:hypothetical protein
MQVRLVYADRPTGALERFRRRCAELAAGPVGARLSPSGRAWGTLEAKHLEMRTTHAPENPT